MAFNQSIADSLYSRRSHSGGCGNLQIAVQNFSGIRAAEGGAIPAQASEWCQQALPAAKGICLICRLHSPGDSALASFRNWTFPAYRHLLGREGVSPESDDGGVIIVCGWVNANPAGLALAQKQPDGVMRLISIMVTSDLRRRGLASKMLSLTEEASRQRDSSAMEAVFRRPLNGTRPVQEMLRKAGFGEPYSRCLVFEGTRERFPDAPWMDRVRLPSAFAAFPWIDLSETDRIDILERQRRSPWYPAPLDPFGAAVEGDAVEPHTSLGLRYRGEVVGWFVNHRISRNTLRFSLQYVREDLQPYGVALAMMAESLRRLRDNPSLRDLRKGIFTVRYLFPKMQEFALARLAPYLRPPEEFVGMRKPLPAVTP